MYIILITYLIRRWFLSICQRALGECTEYLCLTTVLHHLFITPCGSVRAIASLTWLCCTRCLSPFKRACVEYNVSTYVLLSRSCANRDQWGRGIKGGWSGRKLLACAQIWNLKFKFKLVLEDPRDPSKASQHASAMQLCSYCTACHKYLKTANCLFQLLLWPPARHQLTKEWLQ